MRAVASLKNHANLFGLRGVVRRAILAAGGNPIFTVTIDDQKLVLRLGTTDVAVYEHVFVKREYDLPLSRSPKTIVDAGANIGLSSAYFALRYPKAKIIAIEPDNSNFCILKRNAFGGIIPVHAALWHHDGAVDLHDPGGGHWSLQVRSGTKVRAVSMLTLMAEYELDQIDLLKLDVEGSEIEILSNANWMSRVDTICAELHDRFRPGCQEVFNAATGSFLRRWSQGELTCAARQS